MSEQDLTNGVTGEGSGGAAVATPVKNEKPGKLPAVWPWQKAWWTREHIIAVLWTSAVFVVVTIAGMLVQSAAQATGAFGPSLDALIDDQKENFTKIQDRLDKISTTEDPKERERLLKELEALLAKQQEYTTRAHTELRTYESQVEQMREEALAARGTASGVEFWVANNESMVVGEEAHVVAVTAIQRSNDYIQVNYRNEKRYMYPGDVLEIETSKGKGKVIFRQAKDSRAGFDYVAPGKDEKTTG